MKTRTGLFVVVLLCGGIASVFAAEAQVAEPAALLHTSFEGDLEGWMLRLNRGAQAEVVFDSKTAVFGDASLRIKPTLLCAPDDKPYPTNVHIWYDRFRLEAGKSYVLSAWVRSDGPRRTFYLGVRRADEPVSLGTTPFDASELWRRYEFVVTPDEEIPDARLQIIAGAILQPLWVDCVAFREVSGERLMPADYIAWGREWARPDRWEGDGVVADPQVPEVRISGSASFGTVLPRDFRIHAALRPLEGPAGLDVVGTFARGGERAESRCGVELESAVAIRIEQLGDEFSVIQPGQKGSTRGHANQRISFEVTSGEVGLIAMEGYEMLLPERPDGSSEKEEYTDPATGARILRLTHSVYNDKHAYYDVSPWSPDGSMIVFCSALPGEKASSVYVMEADGTNIRKVGESTTFGMHTGNFPCWAADGESIYYRTHFGEGEERRHGTARAFLDSGEVQFLPLAVRQVSMSTGRLLETVSSPDAEVRGLFSYAADGTDKQALATLGQCVALSPKRSDIGDAPTNFQNCKWNADGDKALVVFIGGRDMGDRIAKEIYVVNADGSDLHFVTAFNHHPIWHPNGEQIIYNGPDGLYLVNCDGTDNHKISDCGQGHPSFSPDGSMMVTDGFGGEWRDKLITIDPTTGEWQALCSVPTVHGRSHETGTHPHPCWAPDGKSIIYDSDETGHCQLYQVFLD